jgi:pimeloyl-ACP methyl ester carboxylesterase
MANVFVPGFAARPAFYRPALTPEWTVHEPPSFRQARTFDQRVAALRDALDGFAAPVTLAGHSMGAALAVAAALAQPDLVGRLLLVAPAGLPLTKPITASLRDFRGQVKAHVYPSTHLIQALREALAAPLSTLRLARAVRALDLRTELAAVRRRGIPCDIVACVGDTLTPTEHCREIARLTGGRFRQIDAAGGHMWMLFEPAAFASLLI